MTLFVRLLDVPVDDKAERLREAVQGKGGASMRRDLADMANVPGAAFVYWLQPALLDLFRTESRWEDFESRCGLGTLDDFRFLRLWWEVPPNDAGWVPFAKGGRFSPFHVDIALKVNWHGGDELKASVERKVGSASRKVQGQEFYFREGLTWPRLPHVVGSFQFLPRGCIYSDGGPGIFSRDHSELGPLCAVLNSAPFLFLLECLMPRGSEGGQTLKYEAGYITSVPFPVLDRGLASKLAKLAEEGWEVGLERLRSFETSLRFAGPAPLNSHGVLDARMTHILDECDALSAEALSLDETSIADVAAWARLRRSQALPPSIKDERTRYASAYLSWCVGRAFGRFRPVERENGKAAFGPFDALPELPPAASSADGGTALPWRNILVDDRGHPDDIVTAVTSFVAEDREAIVDLEPDELRDWLAREFFAEHLATYSGYRRKAPIYWQLATPTASYSVWLYYPALTADTLYRVHSDYARPKLLHERSNLDKLRSECGPSPSAAQRKDIERQQRFVDELQAFADDIGKLAPLWAPKLDDGVIINFAPLWCLVGHNKPWQKDLVATWRALSEGKYDWTGIALRLWPERVVPACVDDRSFAIAHGLVADFWEETAPGKWSPKASPPRAADEVAAGLSIPAVREALAELQAGADPATPGRRARRRS